MGSLQVKWIHLSKAESAQVWKKQLLVKVTKISLLQGRLTNAVIWEHLQLISTNCKIRGLGKVTESL